MNYIYLIFKSIWVISEEWHPSNVVQKVGKFIICNEAKVHVLDNYIYVTQRGGEHFLTVKHAKGRFTDLLCILSEWEMEYRNPIPTPHGFILLFPEQSF